MRTLLALALCFAFTGLMHAEDQDNNKNKKNKHEQTQIQTKQKLFTPNNFRATNTNLPAVQSNARWKGPSLNAKTQIQSNAQYKLKQKTWVAQNFKLQTNTHISGVQFQGNVHIAGSQNWKGAPYTAFRLYTPIWHDRAWWVANHTRIILIGGGYYYWDNGYWYPAWGYDPNYQFYAYDGPIYAYNDLPPDQVIANVQAALQQRGFYQGEVDGLLGPLTRAALAQYQAAHGLYPTSAIDEPTLNSLGMV